ncbi:MAG: hypothetical protein QRY71_05715 [Candidatus Rhabdochlamydia sp.]
MSSISKTGHESFQSQKRALEPTENNSTTAKIQKVSGCLEETYPASSYSSTLTRGTVSLNTSLGVSKKNSWDKSSAYLHQISQFNAPLKEIYAVPRAHFLQLIHDYPEQAGLYFNLARTLDAKARITLLCQREFTAIELFQKAVDLLTEEERHNLMLAQAFKEARFHSSIDEDLEELQEKFYLNLIANSSCPEQFYRALASIKDQDINLHEMHELSTGAMMSNLDLLMKGLEHNPLDHEAYITLAIGSHNLGQALSMPGGSIACWKQLLLQAIDINPTSSSALFSLICMMQCSNILNLDDIFKEELATLTEEGFLALKSQEDVLKYAGEGKIASKVRLLNGEVVSHTDLFIRLYQLSDGKEAFMKALYVIHAEQNDVQSFSTFVEELIKSSIDFGLKWDMVFSIIEYMMCWNGDGAGLYELLLWIKENTHLALEKQIIFPQAVNEGSLLYSAKASFETLHQTPLRELLELVQKEPKQAALYCHLARKFHLLGYRSDDSLHEFGYENSNQLFLTAIKLDPMNSYLYYHFIENHENYNIEENINFYLMAIDLNPKESFFYSGLAKHTPRFISLFDGKNFLQNELIFEALLLNPHNDEAYTSLGKTAKKETVRLTTGEVLTRQECYLKALEINPWSTDAYMSLFLHLIRGQENLEEAQAVQIEIGGKRLHLEDLLLQACQIQRKIFFKWVSRNKIYQTSPYLKFLKCLKESALPYSLKKDVYARTLRLLRYVSYDYFEAEVRDDSELMRELFNFFRHEEKIPLAIDPTLHKTQKEYLMDVYSDPMFPGYHTVAVLELIRQLHEEELTQEHNNPSSLKTKKEFILERMSYLNHHPLACCYLADLMEKEEIITLTVQTMEEGEESPRIHELKFSKEGLYLQAIETVEKSSSQNPVDLEHAAIVYSSLAHDLEQDENVLLLDGSGVSSEGLCLKALKLDPKCALAYHVLAKNFQNPFELEGKSYLSKQDIYLQAIAMNPHHPIAYYELGRLLKQQETVILLNGLTLAKKQLYRRAIQLGIKTPHAHYEMGMMMSEKDQIRFPWNPSITLVKGNLLAQAFELAPNSSFYLYKLTDYLFKKSRKVDLIKAQHIKNEELS